MASSFNGTSRKLGSKPCSWQAVMKALVNRSKSKGLLMGTPSRSAMRTDARLPKGLDLSVITRVSTGPSGTSLMPGRL